MSDFGGSIQQRDDYAFAVIGVPYDEKSTYLRGAAGGPAAIRHASTSAMINPFTELGVDLSTETVIADLGDISVAGDYSAVSVRIESKIEEALHNQAVPIILGGDHSISYPAVRAFARRYPTLNILHFDAHPDLYDVYQGDAYAHACPFARIMERGLAQRVVQIGIRAATADQRERAARFGIEMLEMISLSSIPSLVFSQPLYISFDMDSLDPAFAPGVSHCEPGGLSTREALHVLHKLQADIVGLDVVELNPVRDVSGITAAAAAKIAMEVMGKVVRQRSQDRSSSPAG